MVNVKSISSSWSFGRSFDLVGCFDWALDWLFSLLGTPTVSEWPEIAQCLYYQTGLPRFPLDGVSFSRLPMSPECRQFLKVTSVARHTLFTPSLGHPHLQSSKPSHRSSTARRTRLSNRSGVSRSIAMQAESARTSRPGGDGPSYSTTIGKYAYPSLDVRRVQCKYFINSVFHNSFLSFLNSSS